MLTDTIFKRSVIALAVVAATASLSACNHSGGPIDNITDKVFDNSTDNLRGGVTNQNF